MKRFGNPVLSLAAPVLTFVALFGLIQRKGPERFQSVPALVVGTGLIISGALGRRNRRKKLLDAIRNSNKS